MFLLFILASHCFAEPCNEACYEARAEFWMAKADSLALWKSVRWKRILFYRNHLLGEESDVDGGFFLLSPQGKTDPRAEMYATLRGLFSPTNIYAQIDTPQSAEMHPQVKFPLRLKYLQRQLQIPDSAFPKINRNRFEKWIHALNPEHFSVVFASAYLGNPASAMGHTFLRIHSKHNVKSREILDYGINYAGNTPPNENTVVYSLKGIIGLYPGLFGLLPYYVSLQKYIHIENRDLWYYHLHLSPEQQWDILAHLWELGSSWEHYYFFTENCSYFLAHLIEIALPDEQALMDDLPYMLVPIETIKSMQKLPNFIDSMTWRPATLTRVRDRYNQLPSVQKELVQTLLWKDTLAWIPAFEKAHLSKNTEAFLYDLALDYALVQKRKKKDSVSFKRHESLLQYRVKNSAKPKDVEYHIDTTQYAPHRIHPPYRFQWGGGLHQYKPFGMLGFRVAYQDLNQFNQGLNPNDVLEFMDIRLRYWDPSHIRLHALRVLQLKNFPTQNDIQYPTAMRIDVGMDRPPDTTRSPDSAPLIPYFKMAAGKSVDYSGSQTLIGFALAGLHLRMHSEYDYWTQVGPFLNTGLKWNPHRWVSMVLESEMTYSVFSSREWELKHSAELRIGGPQIELRLGSNQWNHRNEGSAKLFIHY